MVMQYQMECVYYPNFSLRTFYKLYVVILHIRLNISNCVILALQLERVLLRTTSTLNVFEFNKD